MFLMIGLLLVSVLVLLKMIVLISFVFFKFLVFLKNNFKEFVFWFVIKMFIGVVNFKV